MTRQGCPARYFRRRAGGVVRHEGPPEAAAADDGLRAAAPGRWVSATPACGAAPVSTSGLTRGVRAHKVLGTMSAGARRAGRLTTQRWWSWRWWRPSTQEGPGPA